MRNNVARRRERGLGTVSLSGRGGARVGTANTGAKVLSIESADTVRSVADPTPVPSPPPEGHNRKRRTSVESAKGIYETLAPLARAQGTLIPATEVEFRALCDLVAIQQRLTRALLRAKTINARWFTLQKTHDTVMRRLEVKLRSYRLAPMGRPLVEATPSNPQTTLEALKARGRAVSG